MLDGFVTRGSAAGVRAARRAGRRRPHQSRRHGPECNATPRFPMCRGCVTRRPSVERRSCRRRWKKISSEFILNPVFTRKLDRTLVFSSHSSGNCGHTRLYGRETLLGTLSRAHHGISKNQNSRPFSPLPLGKKDACRRPTYLRADHRPGRVRICDGTLELDFPDVGAITRFSLR